MPPRRSTQSKDLQIQHSPRSASFRSSSRSSQPAQCPIEGCGRKLSRKSDLQRHMESKHPESLTYEVGTYDCPFPECGYTTKQKSNLTPHVVSHVRPDYLDANECPYIGCDSYASYSAYTSPVLRHAAQCKFRSNRIKEHLKSRWYVDKKGKLKSTTPTMRKALAKISEEVKGTEERTNWIHAPESSMLLGGPMGLTQEVEQELIYDTVPVSTSGVLAVPLHFFDPSFQTGDNSFEVNAPFVNEKGSLDVPTSLVLSAAPSMTTPPSAPWRYDSEQVSLINTPIMMAPAVCPPADFKAYAKTYAPPASQQVFDQMMSTQHFATSITRLFSHELGSLQPPQSDVYHSNLAAGYSTVPAAISNFRGFPSSLYPADPSGVLAAVDSELPDIHRGMSEGFHWSA